MGAAVASLPDQCGSADPRRSLRCNPPALAPRRSCRLSFAVLIVLVCPGSSVYVNRPLRLEHRVMRSLAADMKKMYITPVYLAPSDGFIDYLYRLCWSGASNNGLLSSFKMVFWGKRKGVILLFCRLFLRPPLWGGFILLCSLHDPPFRLHSWQHYGFFTGKAAASCSYWPPVYFRIHFRVSVLSVSAANQPRTSATLAAWAESLKSVQWSTNGTAP